MSRFLERLAQETPIVADGGMGALLSSAVSGLRCPEEANIRAPESVLEVHLGYIRAGADLIETNSFGANRPKLARHFLADLPAGARHEHADHGKASASASGLPAASLAFSTGVPSMGHTMPTAASFHSSVRSCCGA